MSTRKLEPRRRFLSVVGLNLVSPALAYLRSEEGAVKPTLPVKAKSVIFLMQTGGPSHIDFFDDKPELLKLQGEEIPASVLGNHRLTTMSADKKNPCLPAAWKDSPRGRCGMWVGDLLPHTAAIADDLCFLRSVQGDQINHAPAVTQLLTGHNLPGRPSIGAWLTYGLGSEAKNLPAFVVLTSRDEEASCGQFFYDHYWCAGFLPSKFQGVPLRSSGDPVLYLGNPAGVSRQMRRDALDDLGQLNRLSSSLHGDPETQTRIAQHEMAFRMQDSVPELADLSKEPKADLDLYGPAVGRRGSYAFNCLMARRLVERGVRFVQLMHPGWNQHGNLPTQLPVQCRDTDRPSAGLVTDLKRRGMLTNTLVIWGGEFGRTPFGQGDVSNNRSHGRDHHPRAFTIWMAGGGVEGGYVHGASDEFGFRAVEKPVHIHDLQATLLHLCGIDHTRLTYRFQGRDFRLIDRHLRNFICRRSNLAPSQKRRKCDRDWAVSHNKGRKGPNNSVESPNAAFAWSPHFRRLHNCSTGFNSGAYPGNVTASNRDDAT